MHRTVYQLPASLQAEEEAVPHQEEESKLTFNTDRTPPTPLLPVYCWGRKLSSVYLKLFSFLSQSNLNYVIFRPLSAFQECKTLHFFSSRIVISLRPLSAFQDSGVQDFTLITMRKPSPAHHRCFSSRIVISLYIDML